MVDTEDLVDAKGVAELLGLAHRNTVSVYQRRYPDMPRPIVDLGSGRAKLWLWSDMKSWAQSRKPTRRPAPKTPKPRGSRRQTRRGS